MDERLKAGDFAKYTRSTRKTINYYHKIGLLPEPQRSNSGYRLYGPEELKLMRWITLLRSLGLNLKSIKAILDDENRDIAMRSVLRASCEELDEEKKAIEERLQRIAVLLNDDSLRIDEDYSESSTFQRMGEILGASQIAEYVRTCPEIYQQHRRLYSILDDFEWSKQYGGFFRALAGFWKEHPEHYGTALDYGARCAALAPLPVDDPRIDSLAREAAGFIRSIGLLEEIAAFAPLRSAHDPMYKLRNEMIVGELPPARIRFEQLVQQYLSE